MTKSGLERSSGLIPGKFTICSWYIVLPTSCAFLPTTEILFVNLMSSFHGGISQRSCPKEGGQTPPPRLGFFDGDIIDSLRCEEEF